MSDVATCWHCGGSGIIVYKARSLPETLEISRRSLDDALPFARVCPTCQGTGKQKKDSP